MILYDMAKDAASLASKLQNIDLTNLLMDIQQNALDMQDQLYKLQRENQRLQDEIAQLNSLREMEQDVEEHLIQPYITFKSDPDKKKYCANCWNRNKIRIKFTENRGAMSLDCPECATRVVGEESGLKRKSLNSASICIEHPDDWI